MSQIVSTHRNIKIIQASFYPCRLIILKYSFSYMVILFGIVHLLYIYVSMYIRMCVCVCVYIYIYIIYIYIYIYLYICVAFNMFPDFFFVPAFKIVINSWKFTMLLLYISWDDWPIFMISASNEQLQQQLEYTLLKPDCHSWWISKMQSGRRDTLEEWYAIKFCFKLGRNATEKYGMLQTTFGASCNEFSISFWVAEEIQRRHGVCEGWWEVWEE